LDTLCKKILGAVLGKSLKKNVLSILAERDEEADICTDKK
jgi:hypothetical protein